jgi:hypothetical protein
VSNAVASAARKLPPLERGEFRFVTNSMTGENATDGGPRRFRAVASSTITDLSGNTISLKALNEMRDDFRSGLTIFMDHDYTDVVNKVFGTTDMAEVVETSARDERTGTPIYDLIVGGIVNEPNKNAVQLHESMAGGYVKFGTSIGAIVRKHSRDKETGGMLIDSLTAKEASIVGIPKNQRSWAYKASVAAADLGIDEVLADDDPEPEPDDGSAQAIDPLTQAAIAGTTIISLGEDSPPVTITTTGTTTGVTTNIPGVTTWGEVGTVQTSDNILINTDDPAAEAAPETEPTPGGQEADVATPETAPATEDEAADPAIEQKAAADFEVEDVVALVNYTKRLVEEIGHLRSENERLTGEIAEIKAGYDRLSSVEKDATEAIARVMELPLSRRAVGHVQELTNAYPQLDPRVSAYIARATQEKK